MTTAAIAAAGLAAGLHGALYGAYKDSPHESFLPRRFAREIAIALSVAFGRFLAVGTIGRLAHFAVVAFVPDLLWRIA